MKVSAAKAGRLKKIPIRGSREIAMPPTEKSILTIEKPLDSLISKAIQKSPHLKYRNVQFETQEGRVVLRGTVGSYYQKQMAQETLRRVEGVDQIENHLEVNWI